MFSQNYYITISYLEKGFFGRVLNRARRLVNRWVINARTRQQLLELEDHLLEDIGLTREQALHEANKAFYE